METPDKCMKGGERCGIVTSVDVNVNATGYKNKVVDAQKRIVKAKVLHVRTER